MNKNSLFVVKAPEPLPSDVQLDYFKRLRNGDLSVREELINHNINLVIHVVKTRFYDTQYDMNDLVSEGIIGLMTAVDTFDYDITPKFSTYAVKVIENQILMLLRKPDKKNISLEETLYTKNEENGLTLGDTLRDKNVDLEEEHLSKDLSQIIIKLIDEIEDERERDIVRESFGFGCERVSQRVLAEKYKVRQPTISRILSKSIRIIAYKLELMDLIEIPSKQRERLNFDELIELIEKNKVKINIPQVENKTNKRFRTIYEYFEEFSHEEVDEAISYLNPRDERILFLRFGGDFNNPVVSEEWNSSVRSSFYNHVIPKIREILHAIKEKDDSIKTLRAYRNNMTLFELFNTYTRDEIIKAVSMLDSDDERLIYLKYGDNLDQRTTSSNLTEKERIRVSNNIKRKLEKILYKNRVEPNSCIKRFGNRIVTIKLIYEYFPESSHEDVDYVISLLSDDEKKVIWLRYGDDLNNPATSKDFTEEEANKLYRLIIPKIKRRLNRIKNGKELKETRTFYSFFEGYNKEEVNEVIEKLTPEEREIIYLKYGYDLENTSNVKKLDKGMMRMLNASIVPKIRVRLLRNRKNNGEEIPVKKAVEKQAKEIKTIDKEDYIKLVNFLKNSNISEVFDIVDPRDIIIISLRFGFVQNRCYSVEEISKFLLISEKEVVESIKKTLLTYKNRINTSINDAITQATNELRLKQKQEE